MAHPEQVYHAGRDGLVLLLCTAGGSRLADTRGSNAGQRLGLDHAGLPVTLAVGGAGASSTSSILAGTAPLSETTTRTCFSTPPAVTLTLWTLPRGPVI